VKHPAPNTPFSPTVARNFRSSLLLLVAALDSSHVSPLSPHRIRRFRSISGPAVATPSSPHHKPRPPRNSPDTPTSRTRKRPQALPPLISLIQRLHGRRSIPRQHKARRRGDQQHCQNSVQQPPQRGHVPGFRRVPRVVRQRRSMAPDAAPDCNRSDGRSRESLRPEGSPSSPPACCHGRRILV
jgi:hypothetical protein